MDLKTPGRSYWGGILIATVLVGIGLAFIFMKFPHQDWQALLEIQLGYLLGALCLTAGLWLVEAGRMQLILKVVGQSLPWKKVLAINLAFAFAAAVTPAGSGGPPAHAYLLYRYGLKPEKAVVAATARMVLSLLFFGLINPILVIFFQPRFGLPEGLRWLVLMGALIISLAVLVFFLLTLKPVLIRVLIESFLPLRFRAGFRGRAVAFTLAWRELLHSKNYLYLTLIAILTFAYWCIFFSSSWLLAWGLGSPAGWLPFVARMTLVYFLLSYVPLPGGSGVAEISYAAVFAGFIDGEVIGALVAGWRFLTYYINIIVGGLALWWLLKRTT